MEFVFYNEVTGEEKIIFADDAEAAEVQLLDDPNPNIWRLKRPTDDLPVGMFDEEDF